MTFGIEARLPFLDYRLVEAAIALPATALVRDGFSKHILRDAMEGLLPDDVRWRRDKLGFATPEKRWLLERAAFVRSVLNDAGDLEGRLNRAVIQRFQSGSDQDLAATPGLVRLLATAVWLRRDRNAVIAETAA